MQIEEWNKILGDEFLNAGPGKPIYFSVTDAELERLNQTRGLGLENPSDDLKKAIQRVGLRYGRWKHDEWTKSGRNGYPPWLPFLAASVLVVDRVTEQGGTRKFYDPFTEFIGHRPRVEGTEYQGSIRWWWVELTNWLKDSESGDRGFSTWKDVPTEGSFSVIGHAYTQIVLRREDRRNLELFLGNMEMEGRDALIIKDPSAAATHVVEALRRWARGRRSLTPRLRLIVEGPNGRLQEGLGYALMAQLFRDRTTATGVPNRVVEIVPILDEFDKKLFLGVVAPGWVSESSPLHLEGFCDPLEQPDLEYLFDLKLTDAHLREGWTSQIEDSLSVSLEGSDIHVLVKGLGSWRGSHRAEEGSRVYLLVGPGVSEREGIGGEALRRIRGLPEGWSITGPRELTAGLARQCAIAATQKGGGLFPKLRGGLRLDRACNYLLGGEPVLELPGIEDLVTVDADSHMSTDGELNLSALDLGPGEHFVVAGPYELRFSSVRVEQPPSNDVRLGRDPAGQVVSTNETESTVVAGARFHPTRSIEQTPRRLSPFTSYLKLFGVPGEVAEIEPTRAQWAEALSLGWNAIEVVDRSTYPHFDRIVTVPEWIAWEGPEGWVVACWKPWQQGVTNPSPHLEPADWRNAVAVVGDGPSIFKFPDQSSQDEADLLASWQDYARMIESP